MRTITFIRHGFTEANFESRYVGARTPTALFLKRAGNSCCRMRRPVSIPRLTRFSQAPCSAAKRQRNSSIRTRRPH